MIELTLDGALGMEVLHNQLADALHFPDFYGRNLDAMYDCLTDLDTDVQFRLINMNALGRRGYALQLLLAKAAVLNPHITFIAE